MMSVAAGPLTDIQPQPPSASVKVSTGRAKMTRQILTENPNPFAPARGRPYAKPSRLRRVAAPCSPISGNAVAYRPQTSRRLSLTSGLSGKPVQISIDAAGPCGGGVAARAQHDADKTMVTL